MALMHSQITISRADALIAGRKGDQGYRPLYLRRVKRMEVQKGEQLQVAGARPTHLFHVVSGLLRAYFVDETGKEHTYMFAPEGWTLADLEATGFTQSTSLVIEAMEPSVVDVLPIAEHIDHPDFDPLAELKRMHRRAGVLQRRVLMMMSSSALERYEFFLATYPELSHRVSQKLIASYLGITPQALSMIRRRRVEGTRGSSSS